MSVITSGPAARSRPAKVTRRSVRRFASASPTWGTFPISPCAAAAGSQSTRDGSCAMTKYGLGLPRMTPTSPK